jgi:hypothetical protein
MAYFPFEDYILFSSYKDNMEKYEQNISLVEEMYQKDLRKKNSIAKYVNALTIDPFDEVSLKRLYFVFMFFKNIFTKEATLRFINKKLTEEEKLLIGRMVFDMFVKDNEGQIGEEREFLSEAVEISKFVKYDGIVDENWTKLQEEIAKV